MGCMPSKHHPLPLKAGKLGVIRLDYDYPPAPGDIDSQLSFDYQVVYRVVPGLTFDVCQSGQLTDEVKVQLDQAINDLIDEEHVHGITGDCGFMMYLQKYIREHSSTTVPVFMSALAQLPAITTAYGKAQKVAVFTANGEALKPMYALISEECGVNVEDNRFVIVDCMGVPGFEAVAAGEKVNVEEVTPGMVEAAKAMLKQNPHVRALLLECTELPPYADALRKATGLPVYDAITACNFFMSGVQDNPRFGINDWQERFKYAAAQPQTVEIMGLASGSQQEYSRDRAPPTTPERSGTQEEYHYGQDLDDVEAAKLTNKRSNTAHRKSKKEGENQKTHKIKSGHHHKHTKPGETAKV